MKEKNMAYASVQQADGRHKIRKIKKGLREKMIWFKRLSTIKGKIEN